MEFVTLLKSKEKALLGKAFSIRLRFITPFFDCADYIPATFNFFILSRFSFIDECTYLSKVIVTEA